VSKNSVSSNGASKEIRGGVSVPQGGGWGTRPRLLASEFRSAKFCNARHVIGSAILRRSFALTDVQGHQSLRGSGTPILTTPGWGFPQRGTLPRLPGFTQLTSSTFRVRSVNRVGGAVGRPGWGGGFGAGRAQGGDGDAGGAVQRSGSSVARASPCGGPPARRLSTSRERQICCNDATTRVPEAPLTGPRFLVQGL
jgi:hypothetical protein